MCGRFTSLLSPELLEAIFGVKPPSQTTPRYNIAPSQKVPIVRESGEGERKLNELVWGLIPAWAKDATGSKFINARCESAHEKPSFRQALKYDRAMFKHDPVASFLKRT